MRILFSDEGELKLALVSCVGYDSEEKEVYAEEAGIDDQIIIPMEKKQYEKGIQELMKNGYIDWSEYEGHYCDYEN